MQTVLGGRGARFGSDALGAARPAAGRRLTGPIALSLGGTVVIFIALATLASVFSQRVAESEARAGSSRRAVVTARVALAPFLVDGLLDRDPQALEPLDTAARRLIAEGEALHIRIWSTSGQVLWADNDVAGATFDLEADEVLLFGTDDFNYRVGHLEKPENAFDDPRGERVLEVYLGSHTSPSNTPVLVETYYSYATVSDRADELRRAFLPLLVGGLALLAAAQIPLTMGLARWLERYQKDRERLLNEVIETVDSERQRIAAQVHDGALQDLIGVSYELSGVAADAPENLRPKLDELGREVRRTIRSVRSTLTSIYPAGPHADGWIIGLSSVVDVLRSRGIIVEIDVPAYDLSPTEQDVILRTTLEAMRNALSHSQCRMVVVRLVRDDDGHLMLSVRDDGRGFSSDTAVRQRRSGHLGLQLITDLARSVGAVLTVESNAGTGTEVRLDLMERVMDPA